MEKLYKSEVNINGDEVTTNEDDDPTSSSLNLNSPILRERIIFDKVEDKRQSKFHAWGGKRLDDGGMDTGYNGLNKNTPDKVLYLYYYVPPSLLNQSKEEVNSYEAPMKTFRKRMEKWIPALSEWAGKINTKEIDNLDKKSSKFQPLIFQRDLPTLLSPEQSMKRYPSFNSWAGKRAYGLNSFGGKKAAAFNSWGGKRAAAFNSWGGKKSAAFNSWGGKRTAAFSSWGGKRASPFNSLGAKRSAAFNSWGGKRTAAFNSWGGKREESKTTDWKVNKKGMAKYNNDFENDTSFHDSNIYTDVKLSEKQIEPFNSFDEIKKLETLPWSEKSTPISSIGFYRNLQGPTQSGKTENGNVFSEKEAETNDLDINFASDHFSSTEKDNQVNDYYITHQHNPGFVSWTGKELNPQKKMNNRTPPFSSLIEKRSPLFSNWYNNKVPIVQMSNGKRRPAFSSWGGKRSESQYQTLDECLDCLQKHIINENQNIRSGESDKITESKIDLRDKRDTISAMDNFRTKRSGENNFKKTRTVTRMLLRGGAAWPKAFSRGVDFYAWGGKRSLL